MALNSNFKVQGQKQGAFPSDIQILSFTWGASSPRDAATGQAMGRRQYRPLQVTKHADVNTPHLATALANNEVLTSVELTYKKPTRGGKQEVFFSIKLKNAGVQNYEISQATSEIPSQPGEVVTFTYEQIEITYCGENPDGSLGGGHYFTDMVAKTQ